MNTLFDIDMAHFNMDEMSKLGISFPSEEEAQHFVDIVRKSVEDRINGRLLSIISGEEREKLASIHSSVERERWLRANISDYKAIVNSSCEEIAVELLVFRYDIPGVEILFGADLGNDSIEWLLQSRSSLLSMSDRMRDKGIYSLRDLLSCWDEIGFSIREELRTRHTLDKYLKKRYRKEFNAACDGEQKEKTVRELLTVLSLVIEKNLAMTSAKEE